MIIYRVGVVRTNRKTDKKMTEKIGNMWKEARKRFRRYDGNIYAVYYNFKGGHDDDFDYTIGSEYKLEDKNPIKFNVENYDYKVFEKGLVRDKGIIGAWEHICNLEENGKINRAFGIDYEIYYPDGEIEIYVSVNKE